MPKERSGLASAQQLQNQYKEFNYGAVDGFNYESDGGETERFFDEHSNVNDLIEQMSYQERRAFETWATGWFMNGQQWQGYENMRPRDQEMTKIYDKYLDQAKLDRGIVVCRIGSARLLGLDSGKASSLEQLQALEGQIIPAKGNMSFGAAKEGLMIGGERSKNVEFRLHIPGGTTGAGMWIGDSRINGWGSDQREYLTNRDTLMEIGKTKYDRRRGLYVVELKYRGRQAHDYGR